MKWNYSKTWYHGSPVLFTQLLMGSTITQDRELARIFSHKPSIVAVDEKGNRLHNGKVNGNLYIIDEEITDEDVYPHPNSTMKPGEEWLINRPLKVRKLVETIICKNELLTGNDEKELSEKLGKIQL